MQVWISTSFLLCKLTCRVPVTPECGPTHWHALLKYCPFVWQRSKAPAVVIKYWTKSHQKVKPGVVPAATCVILKHKLLIIIQLLIWKWSLNSFWDVWMFVLYLWCRRHGGRDWCDTGTTMSLLLSDVPPLRVAAEQIFLFWVCLCLMNRSVTKAGTQICLCFHWNIRLLHFLLSWITAVV